MIEFEMCPVEKGTKFYVKQLGLKGFSDAVIFCR